MKNKEGSGTSVDYERLRIFTGNSNIELVQKIADQLGTSIGKAVVKTFSDGEINVEIHESVRGMDVFVIQSVCYPVNDNLMELLILIDALKRASAERITAVLPYYGYARQDRKVLPRAPISAKLVADLITTAGASRVLTVDLHAGQIQGFFNIPVDHLFAAPVLLEYLRMLENEMVVVSPDAGGVERARAFAKRLNASLAIIDKRREAPNVSQVMNIIGDVEGPDCGSVGRYCGYGRNAGSGSDCFDESGRQRGLCLLHPSRSVRTSREDPYRIAHQGDGRDRLHSPERKGGDRSFFKVLSISGILAESIQRIYRDESVSSLFV